MTNNRFNDNLNFDSAAGSSHCAPMATDKTGAAGNGLDDDRVFPVRLNARLHYRLDTEQVVLAESLIVQTGILDKLAEWQRIDQRTVASRTSSALVSDRAVLVGLLLLAGEHRALQIGSLAELFQFRLAPESRTLLQLSEPANLVGRPQLERKRWYIGTCRAVHRLLTLMDPFPQDCKAAATYIAVQAALDAHDSDREKRMKARLDEFTKAFLHMTFMQQSPTLQNTTSRIDLAIGQTFVASPTRSGFSKRTLEQHVAAEASLDPRSLQPGPIDVFAGWWKHETHDSRGKFEWGWAANIAVRVDSEHPQQARFPKLAISATLSMPYVGVAEEAVSLMKAATETGLEPGIVDADMPYWANTRVERLHKPALDLGFTPSTDYRRDQLGVRGTKNGALFIEGKLYCPGMPVSLQNASTDLFDGAIDDETYQDRLQMRTQFELRPKGKPDSKGRFRMMRPALAATHSAGPCCPGITEDDHPDFRDKICTQQSVTFSSEDGLRQRQAFTYGSKQWKEFRDHARDTAATLTSGIKSGSHEDLGNPSRRDVRGFAAAQVFVTILLTNYNLRTIATFMDS
jgi:hypothetical protein